MSKIVSSGYLAKTDGQTTDIDLSEATKWVSSRVRWKGKDTTIQASDRNEGAGSVTIPYTPSGYAFQYHNLNWSSTVTNISPTETIQVRFLRLLSGSSTIVGGWVTLTPGQSTSQRSTVVSSSTYYGGGCVYSAWEEISGYSGLLSATQLNAATTYGTKAVLTTNPSITVGGTTVSYTGTLVDGVESAWSNIPAGISAEQTNTVTNNFDSSSGAWVEIEDTFEPYLPLCTVESPANKLRTVTAATDFIFTLIEDTDNSAAKYHARIRLDDYSSMPAPTSYETKDSQTNWYYWTDPTWTAFPAGGVDPGTKVKFTKTLDLGTMYWDVSSWDDYGYGYTITPYKIRIVVTVNNLYVLDIGGNEYDAYNIKVVETSNGEIGEIIAVIDNVDGTNYGIIAYQDEVLIAFNDEAGNTEEFTGKVRNKNPKGQDLEIYAILGDGILSERIVQEDYPDQDIGQTVSDMITDYCTPLTVTNVDVATGFSEAILTDNKTPLKILEELRKNYGVFFYVDKDWDVHFYVPADITATPTAKISYG